MAETAAKTILFIDDDLVVFTAYKARLVQAGFNVILAGDGLAALRELTLSSPDVVILDLVMPKFNGIEIMGFIRGNPKLKNVPVIVFSTHAIIDSDTEAILNTSFRRLIKGNCSPALMLETIKAALDLTLVNVE